jgi:hypothetical protein
VAQSCGSFAIRAVADNKVNTFACQKRNRGSAQAASAGGDDDGLTGESLFGKVVLKLVVRVGLTRVPMLRGHVLLECSHDLLHV